MNDKKKSSSTESDVVDIDSILQFPCDIDVKIFIKSNAQHQMLVRKLVDDTLEAEQIKSWTTRDSSGAKFLAITAVIYAHSREQIDDLYRKLGDLDQVVMMI